MGRACLPTPPSVHRKEDDIKTTFCVTPPQRTPSLTMSALAEACLPTQSSNEARSPDARDPPWEHFSWPNSPVNDHIDDEKVSDHAHTHSPCHAHISQRNGRGKYLRTMDVGKRSKWLDHVQKHMEEVDNCCIMARKSCSLNCKTRVCNEFVDIRVVKHCVKQSFGEAALVKDWSNIRSNHEAVQNWFHMAHAQRVVDPSNKKVTHVNYTLNGTPVCLGAWAAFHGLRPTTAASIHRQVLSGHEYWNAGLAKQRTKALREQKADLSNAAATWWYTRLGYYEAVVDFGYIQCPRDVCWSMVYEHEFVPEMIALGLNWKQPRQDTTVNCQPCDDAAHEHEEVAVIDKHFYDDADADNHEADEEMAKVDEAGDRERGSISTWYRGRAIALQRWAHEHVGPKAKPFKLVSRAKHSAYVIGTNSNCGRAIYE